MEDITAKTSEILKDPHFMHAVALGGFAFGLTKYMEQGKPLPPAPQLVQIASKPRNTKLLVTLAVIGGSYYYMTQFGHNLPTSQ